MTAKVASKQNERFLRLLRLQTRTFGLLGTVILARAVGTGGLTLFLPTFLIQRGSDLATAGVVASLYFAMGGIGGLVTGILSDRIGRKKILDKKERMTDYVVKLARLLKPNAAVLCGSGGGHPVLDFMMVVKKLEDVGLPTVQVMPEAYGTPEDPGFVHFLPEAKRIVSTGRSPQPVDLPAMPNVIGGTKFFDLPDKPSDSMKIPYRYLYGSMSATGYGRLTARTY